MLRQATFKIETCYKMAIDSAWFLTYVYHEDETVTIIQYERDHMSVNRDMRVGKPIEDEKRTVTHVNVEGSSFKVRNPAHVFDYK